MRPFFSYLGGKFRAHRHYPHPKHKIIIEPFAGSAGYAVHHPSRQVILYDIDPKLYGVWHYLINVSSEEVMKLPLPVDIDDIRDCKIPQEAQWLIGFWFAKGTTQPGFHATTWGRSTKYMDSNSVWCSGIRDRIARQVNQIRHWRVFNKSYPGIGNAHATWYIDPPYQVAGSCYKFGSKLLDYQHLGEWCQSRRGQVIVCENTGADWLPFEHLATIRGTNHPSRTGISHEAMWYREE
jgi:site-specific DNA-adenine methylase